MSLACIMSWLDPDSEDVPSAVEAIANYVASSTWQLVFTYEAYTWEWLALARPMYAMGNQPLSLTLSPSHSHSLPLSGWC